MKKLTEISKPRFYLGMMATAILITLVWWTVENFDALMRPGPPETLKNFKYYRGVTAIPSYVFERETGQAVKLSDYRDKLVVLNFWATWCPPCLAEMPALNTLAETGKDHDIAVLAVSLDQQGRSAVLEFFERTALPALDIFLDPTAAGPRLFGLKGLPSTYILHPNGAMIGYVAGPVEWDDPEVLDFLKSQLQEDKP